jgi:indole-3-glycerol phosphate synthase
MIEKILETKRAELGTLKRRRLPEREKPIIPFSFKDPVNIIAELKRRSPSAGFIGEVNPERIGMYTKYAKAISVVTDTTYFGGSYEFLREVAGQTTVPVLCKDFIIDPVQIDLAYASGADAVLLIARCLSAEELGSLYGHATELGLACLVELHVREELGKLVGLHPEMVGVNARDLDTLEMDLDGARTLLAEVRAPIRIAESGIRSRQDIQRFIHANGFLIGETLMRSKDVEATFRELMYGEN